MTILEIVILAVGLCFDTFAVSLSSGICLPEIRRGEFLKIVFTFAIFQSGFTLCGWLLGSSMESLIKCVDHWIAFGMLFYIGAKMVWESLSKNNEEVCIDIRNTKVLVTAAAATSIDALAVGVTLAIINLSIFRIIIALAAIIITTALSSSIGLKWGRKIGEKAGKRSELIGGLILIFIGVKILVEHLNFLS